MIKASNSLCLPIEHVKNIKEESASDQHANVLAAMIVTEFKEYEFAIQCFAECICISTSIYLMTLSLRYLSDICVKLEQYIAALKLLNIARKNCTMYELTITPMFVNKVYFEKKKKIKKKLNKMRCFQCGRKEKLFCCTGCMEAVYCSKQCQKRHWRAHHRKECAKKWSESYQKLKKYSLFT